MIQLKFSEEEDKFLIEAFKEDIKISKMAIRLNRSYDSILMRLIYLGYLSKKVLRSKFKTNDEIDYELRLEGCSDEEIKKCREHCRVGVILKSVYLESEEFN